MDLVHSSPEITLWSRRERCEGHTIALVPTMGALHDGHMVLVREAARRADRVVVSIFVNPTQFGPGEDFGAYPRDLERDLGVLRQAGGVHAVFVPDVQDVYPSAGNRTWVNVDDMDRWLCGQSRKGHFKGVTTVVARLFARVLPDVAVFGMKDAQQFFVLKRMTRDMGFPVELIGVPTVRAEDGLAMSSRNAYLSEAERADAPRIYRAVAAARQAIMGGERDVDTIEQVMRHELGEARVDYVTIVETEGLVRVPTLRPGMQALAAVAVWYGRARLIDNVVVDVS